jgi:anaerobic ribonucleoside-triphosphate reductase
MATVKCPNCGKEVKILSFGFGYIANDSIQWKRRIAEGGKERRGKERRIEY